MWWHHCSISIMTSHVYSAVNYWILKLKTKIEMYHICDDTQLWINYWCANKSITLIEMECENAQKWTLIHLFMHLWFSWRTLRGHKNVSKYYRNHHWFETQSNQAANELKFKCEKWRIVSLYAHCTLHIAFSTHEKFNSLEDQLVSFIWVCCSLLLHLFQSTQWKEKMWKTLQAANSATKRSNWMINDVERRKNQFDATP